MIDMMRKIKLCCTNRERGGESRLSAKTFKSREIERKNRRDVTLCRIKTRLPISSFRIVAFATLKICRAAIHLPSLLRFPAPKLGLLVLETWLDQTQNHTCSPKTHPCQVWFERFALHSPLSLHSEHSNVLSSLLLWPYIPQLSLNEPWFQQGSTQQALIQ